MKELEIAKKNIKEWKEIRIIKNGNSNLICKTHKQSCKRFLEFLAIDAYDLKDTDRTCENIEDKIKDLQDAISLYKKEGIK